jgi:uncharacterized protein YutE (UPF0331/DUF86 family)
VTLNADLVRTRCGDIEDAVKRLDRIRTMPRAEFLADRDVQDIAVRRLLVAIEAALGLCYHVSARRLQRVPDDFAACFAGLGQAGVIEPALGERLQAMARFRNLLVHMYWKVDYGRVFDVLVEGLEDLRAFRKAMAALM